MRMVVKGNCLKVVNLSRADDLRSRAELFLSRAEVSQSLAVINVSFVSWADQLTGVMYAYFRDGLFIDQLSRMRG
jgi:hypothetical protein